MADQFLLTTPTVAQFRMQPASTRPLPTLSELPISPAEQASLILPALTEEPLESELELVASTMSDRGTSSRSGRQVRLEINFLAGKNLRCQLLGSEYGPDGKPKTYSTLSTAEGEKFNVNGAETGYKAATTTLENDGKVSTYSIRTP